MRFFQARRRWPTRSVPTLFAWNACWFATRVLLTIFYRLRCRGAEHVPSQGPIIYVSNHQSHFDPSIVGSVVWDRPFASMARSSLFSFKPFGWLIRFLGAIPLARGTSDIAAIRMAIRELEGGGCVLLFPEGGRTLDGALQPFLSGVLTIVKRSGAPVVPLAFDGAYDIWPKGRSRPRLRGRILAEACPAIPADELLANGRAAAIERLQRQIETLRLRLRAELRANSGGRYPRPGPGDRPYWEREQNPGEPVQSGTVRASEQ